MLLFPLVVTTLISNEAITPCMPRTRGMTMMARWYGPVDQHGQSEEPPERWRGKSHVTIPASPVRTELPTENILVKMGPSPTLKPLEVIDKVCGAFQRGTDEDVEQLFHFVLPDGELALDNECSAGAMSKFRWTIRKEPRWKNIARRPHAALLKMRTYEIVGSFMTDADVVQYKVKASPYFPDAPSCESEVTFQFQLVRQHASVGAHPSAAEALGAIAECWMVNSIKPDYGEWHVLDPIHAGRAPDSFKPTDSAFRP